MQVMRMGLAAAKRARDLDLLIDFMHNESEDKIRSAGMREMRAIIWRIAKGELAMRLEVWRDNKKCSHLKSASVKRKAKQIKLCNDCAHCDTEEETEEKEA